MTQSHPRPLGNKKWKKRMEHFSFGQVYSTLLFFRWCNEQSLNAYGNPPLLCNSRNSWKMHIVWIINDREKNWRHHADTGRHVQAAVQAHVQCTNLRRCSLAGVAAPWDTGPGQSRCEQIYTKGSEGQDLVPVAEWDESSCTTRVSTAWAAAGWVTF